MRHTIAIGLLCASPALAGDNLLATPGSESGLDGWITFGNVFAEVANPPQFVPFEGEGLASMFGNFTGEFNVSGLFQEFDAVPGSEWMLDVYSRHFSGDAMIGDGPPNSNWVVQKIVFKDAADVEIGAVESVILDGTFPTDVWIDNDPIAGIAPDGTVQVEAFFLYLQPLFDGGAVHLDNASLVLIPAPGPVALLAVGGLALLRRRR